MTRQSYRHCLLRRLTSTFNGRGASRRCTLRRRARSRACCWRAGRMRRRRRTMATHPPSRLQVVQQSRFSLESIGRSPAAALDLVRERAERPQADERRGTFAEAAGHPTRRCISTRQLVVIPSVRPTRIAAVRGHGFRAAPWPWGTLLGQQRRAQCRLLHNRYQRSVVHTRLHNY